MNILCVCSQPLSSVHALDPGCTIYSLKFWKFHIWILHIWNFEKKIHKETKNSQKQQQKIDINTAKDLDIPL